jgi:hypothetical protein
MYYSRIEAAAPVVATVVEEPAPGAGATLLGGAVLVVGVPLLTARLLVYGLGRSVAKLGTLAGIVGRATIEAARSR